MFNKDVVVPGRMRRRIENPRILLLDCPLEYKKGENQTNVELSKEEDWCVGSRGWRRVGWGMEEAVVEVVVAGARAAGWVQRVPGGATRTRTRYALGSAGSARNVHDTPRRALYRYGGARQPARRRRAAAAVDTAEAAVSTGGHAAGVRPVVLASRARACRPGMCWRGRVPGVRHGATRDWSSRGRGCWAHFTGYQPGRRPA